MSDDTPIKRWAAWRKAAVAMDNFKGKTTDAEVARQYDLAISEVEGWIDETQSSMENGFLNSTNKCSTRCLELHPESWTPSPTIGVFL